MNYFEPSIARAREHRSAMDEALWSSVQDLLGEHIGAGGARNDGGQPGNDVRPTSFLDYGAYFDLELVPPALSEVPARAKEEATQHLLNRITATGAPEALPAPPRITNLSTDYYSADQIDRMRRWWDIEPENRMAMTCATAEEFAHSCEAIGVAMDYLRDAAPELHGEVETIVRDIVLSRPDGSNLVNYSGASSFALWGALTINSETQIEWMQKYRQIVHEAGHNLLFSIARDEPLVTDDPADRRKSPVRPDPRPLDGIFHAAYVSAREAYAFDMLLIRHEEKGCLEADDPAILEDLLELSVLAFWDCVETLRAHAELTELGKAVLDDCEAYMAANFSLEPC